MDGLLTSMRLTFLLLFTVLGLSGCGLQFFTPPKENPVISDNVSDEKSGSRIFRILSNTPERRLVVFNMDKSDKKRFGTYCAEAPADAAESISSSFQAALEATLSEQGGNAEAAKTLATAVQALAPRSQGLMLFRDAGYRYCEAYMNGFIDGKELVRKIDGMVKISKSLIEKELGFNEGKIGYGPPAPLPAPQSGSNSDNGADVNVKTGKQK